MAEGVLNAPFAPAPVAHEIPCWSWATLLAAGDKVDAQVRRRQVDCGKQGNHNDHKCMVRQSKGEPYVCVFCGVSDSDWEAMKSMSFTPYGWYATHGVGP